MQKPRRNFQINCPFDEIFDDYGDDYYYEPEDIYDDEEDDEDEDYYF